MDHDRMNRILDTYWDGYEYGTGPSCSQATLMALAEYYGVSEDWHKGLATPFGGGVCHSHTSLCGAISGALMFLGLHVQSGSDDIGAELTDHVRRQFGDLHCDRILSIDFSDEDQVAREKAPKYASICQPMMRSICAWIIERVD